MTIIEKRMEELGITLPPPSGPSPLADHISVKRINDLLFFSGVGPIRNGMPICTGRIVKDIKHELGYESAREAALNLISILKNEVGDLDKVEEIVKVTGFVASDDDFYDQHMILNGASHLFNEIFGEKGKHACVAIGTNVLPFNVPVILDVVVKVQSQN